MGSPPKPWERAGGVATVSSPSPAPATASNNAASSSTPPAMPERPAAINSNLSSPYSYGANSYGASPYSRLGTTYGGYGGYPGPGSYNSLGYGSMGYGMSSMGYGGYGMGYGYGGQPPMDANGRPTLTQSLSSTTEHTFALLHSIVQTFSGVAQMLESTFMATHSSFFAMVGVIEQIGHLRDMLGSVLGLFGLLQWMRDVLTGKTSHSGSMHHEFREFINGRPVQGPSGPPPPRPSKKPLIVFLLAIFGIPYAMSKLVKLLNERAIREGSVAANGAPLSPLDPSQLSFASALYPFNASTHSELSLKQDEIVAITAKLDPRTGAEVDPRTDVEGGEWWKGRTRDSREGWFPRKWVQIIEKQPKVKQVD